MRAQDIVNQLAIVLPTQADDFTTQISVTSISRSGTTVTVTTDVDHGLTAGKQVNMNGVITPINCSITRSGIVGTLVTTSDHDITENAGYDVQIDGATQPEFNGTFTLLTVPNRRTITFQMDDSGPTSASGSPQLLNGFNIFQTYNGLREVTAIPASDQFEYEITDSGLAQPIGDSIVAKTNPRISAAVNFERLLDAYTRQPQDEAWLFVVIGDALADKNRNIDTDSTDNIQNGHFFNQRLIQGVSLYVFLPTSAEISGREARDRCEELLKPICNSILTKKFSSLVENTNNPLMITGHGFQAYNGAFYVHQYAFEATLQLGETDTYIPADDVAFRDIDLTMDLDIGTETFSTLIDLDDEPLP